MTDDMIELARRAVACKGWRWMLGMLAHDGYRMVWVGDGLHRSFRINGSESIGWTDQLLPDLTDPATLGCLLALVREAWGNPLGFVENYGPNDVWNAIEAETIERDREMGLEARSPIVLPPDGAMWVYHPHGQYPDPVEMSDWTSEAEALVAALEAAP